LVRHEALREWAYPDPLSLIARKYRRLPWGFKPARELLAQIPEKEEHGRPWTVGVGFAVGITPDHRMTKEQALRKLDEKIGTYSGDLQRLIPDITEHPFVVQTVFLNLIFNLGIERLSKFKNTLAFLNKRDYQAVADNLEKSLWYRQVGTRAVELVERLRTLSIRQEHLFQ
jgi:lysozyme